DVARAAVHEQPDDALGLGREVRRPGGERVRRAGGRAGAARRFGEAGARGAAEGARAATQEATAGGQGGGRRGRRARRGMGRAAGAACGGAGTSGVGRGSGSPRRMWASAISWSASASIRRASFKSSAQVNAPGKSNTSACTPPSTNWYMAL